MSDLTASRPAAEIITDQLKHLRRLVAVLAKLDVTIHTVEGDGVLYIRPPEGFDKNAPLPEGWERGNVSTDHGLIHDVIFIRS